MVFNICEKVDLKVLFKLFGNIFLCFVFFENFMKVIIFSNLNFIGKFYVNDNKEKVLIFLFFEVVCFSYFVIVFC